MKIKRDDIITALSEARNLSEAMQRYHPHQVIRPVSMDAVITGVQELCGVTIEIRLLPFDSEDRLRGIYLPYDNKTIILIDSGLHHSWQRYVTMKEIGHIVLQDAENVTQDPSKIIEYMVQDGHGMFSDDLVPAADAANETLAKVVAYETLFPHIEREEARSRLSDDPFNLFKLSQAYGIPEHVVEYVLSDAYFSMCEELYAEL